METITRIRADVDAAKKVALARFKLDWGTDSVQDVMNALRHTIPISDSPQHAAEMARRLLS